MEDLTTTQETSRPTAHPRSSSDVNRSDSRLESFLRAHTRLIVVVLSVFAAARILFFAAAFPIFNNNDERFHLMTIQMYAHGHFPGKELPQSDPEFSKSLILYFSPEYLVSQEELDRNDIRGPLTWLPPQMRDAAVARGFYLRTLERWSRAPNFEAQSPPLYYLVAAAWYNLGTAFGLRDWGLSYWTRFLNPIAYALLVCISYLFVRRVYPEHIFLRIAVPALIAVFPQDVFFGVNRDVISPVVCATALLLMVEAIANETAQKRLLLAASFLVGLAFLVEVSNCVFYGSLAATLWTWARGSQLRRRQKVWVVGASSAAALFAPLLWMGRNYVAIGDLTGSSAKMRYFGWTVKPIAEVFHHPLFSLHGLFSFLTRLIRTFWHGEYQWHGVPLRSPGADWLYVISSVVLLGLFAIDLVRRQRATSPVQRMAGLNALFLLVSSVLFLAAISLPFDFHDTPYPSRLYPFFASGRIISGVLLPFALIYVGGLELVGRVFGRRIPQVAMLGCLLLFITISEINVRKIAFSSQYNFFALLSAKKNQLPTAAMRFPHD